MMKRMQYRKNNSREQRSDDTESILKKRIDTFENSTKEILDLFEKRDKLITIDGENTPYEILADYLGILQEISESESEE